MCSLRVRGNAVPCFGFVCVFFLQAFLIAFTSDFLTRLLYQYKFDKEDLSGFVNFTLAYAPVNYTQYPMCRCVFCTDQTVSISSSLILSSTVSSLIY